MNVIENNISGLTRFQFLPRFSDDVDFEEFTVAYFNELENTKSYDRFGRSGQKQQGLDVYSIETKVVIQCKCKNIRRPPEIILEELLKDLKADFKSFTEYNKSIGRKYNRFRFVSTWYDEVKISTECARLSNEDIVVEYWSWDSLLRKAEREIPYNIFTGKLMSLDTSKIPILDPKSTSISADIDLQESGSLSILATEKTQIDLAKPILDRLYDFFLELYSEINYYPVHKFVRVLPFRSEEESSPYYRSSSFSLHTDSDELFRFCDSMIVTSNSVTFKNKEFTDGVEEPERKGKEILQRLTNNLIFEISSERQFINVRFRGHEDCDCERCSFNRFRFVKAIQKLETAPTSMEEKFRLAYYRYKLGDLIGAAISFQKLAKETKGKEHIRYYIASFNQSKLARFIRNRYFADDEPNELLAELDLVNLDDIYQEIRKHDNLGIIKFIYDQSYFLESQQSISSIIEKLRDRFEQQKRGGFSSHSDGWELMNRYLQIYSFLTGNYVIYDEFSEFKNLTNQVIEGVFASYATDETPSGRIVALDDFWVNVIIKYGDATKIKKFSRRYELKSLEYQMSSADGISIFDSFTTFLSQAADLPNELLKNKNKVFAEKYNDYFTNFLTLFGLIEVEDGTLKEVRNELIKFLKNERFLYPNRLSAILFFISAKANQQDVAFIKEMLFMVLKGEGILRRDALQAISSHILDHYDGLTFTDKESEELIQLIKNHIVEHGSSFHLESLVPLGKAVTNKDISLSISAIISDKLDESFLVNLYYLAIMYDVIPNKDDWFRKFRKFSEPDLNRASSVRAFLGGPDNNRYSHINEFINLCYKLGIDMREFNEFNDVDPFYDWLLDLAGFDYTHFEPKWVKEYPTKHYFDEFRKHNIIRENLNRYLSENRDEKIAQVYFDLYASEATV